MSAWKLVALGYVLLAAVLLAAIAHAQATPLPPGPYLHTGPPTCVEWATAFRAFVQVPGGPSVPVVPLLQPNRRYYDPRFTVPGVTVCLQAALPGNPPTLVGATSCINYVSEFPAWRPPDPWAPSPRLER